MSSVENRIEKLEKHIGTAGKQQQMIVLVAGPTTEEKEAAIADYKAKHPEWAEKDISVIYVANDEAKRLTEEILEGKRTEP